MFHHRLSGSLLLILFVVLLPLGHASKSIVFNNAYSTFGPASCAAGETSRSISSIPVAPKDVVVVKVEMADIPNVAQNASVTSMSDGTNTYTRQIYIAAGHSSGLSTELWTTTAIKASSNLTITLSFNRTVGDMILVATYSGVDSVTTNAQSTSDFQGNGPLVQTLSFTNLAVDAWIVGGESATLNQIATLGPGQLQRIGPVNDNNGCGLRSDFEDKPATASTDTFTITYNSQSNARTLMGLELDSKKTVDQPGGIVIQKTDIIYGSIASAAVIGALAFIVGMQRRRP